jgi:hypothetical protein
MNVDKLLAGYQGGALTRGELVFALARLITPENVGRVMVQAPVEVREELCRWALSTLAGRSFVVGSNLPADEARKIEASLECSRVTIREWLRAQDRDGSPTPERLEPATARTPP